MAPDTFAPDHLAKDYQASPTGPRLHVRVVATGGAVTMPIMDPISVPQSLRNDLAQWVAAKPPAVVVIDLGDARWEVETLLETLSSAAREVRGATGGDIVMVISTTQPSVAQVARMVATLTDVALYMAESSSPQAVAAAVPAGKLTSTEGETLKLLGQMGGRVTVSDFATRASLEVTAAGNRLGNLAKRGYVNRVSRSRREGDLYVSPAWFESASYPGELSPSTVDA